MNSWLSSAPKALAAALAALLAGCGPSDGTSDLAVAREAYANGDLVKAAKSCEAALRHAPGNVDALVGLAQVKLDLGDLAAVKSALARVDESARGDTDVRLLSAQLAFHEKDYDTARKLYRAVAADAAGGKALQAEGWAGVGVVELGCENLDAARVAFLKAVRLDRRNPSARYHLGLLYRNGFGFLAAALEQYEIYVRLEQVADPRVQCVQRDRIPEIKEAMARERTEVPGAAQRNSAASAEALKRAEAQAKKGRIDRARAEYLAAYKADPLSYPAALALAKLSSKNASEQLRYYVAACQLAPSSISTAIAAGDLAARLGQSATAAKLYSRALAADPLNLTAADGLIRALRKAGTLAVANEYQSYRDFLAKKR